MKELKGSKPQITPLCLIIYSSLSWVIFNPQWSQDSVHGRTGSPRIILSWNTPTCKHTITYRTNFSDSVSTRVNWKWHSFWFHSHDHSHYLSEYTQVLERVLQGDGRPVPGPRSLFGIRSQIHPITCKDPDTHNYSPIPTHMNPSFAY